MVNTVTQRTLLGAGSDKNIVRLIHILSDGTEETDLIVYDNSAFIANVAKGCLRELWISGSASISRLEWDQDTDSPAFTADPANGGYWDFRSFGGISNPGGAGATGDLVLTTAALDSGDELTLILHITQ
jgi:hypothetical protein